MKNLLLIVLLGISMITPVSALIINEIMSNPIGDDGGREWIELYNNSSSTVDLSSLTVSIKGATAVSAINLSGGSIVAPGGYVIIGSTVSGATKFSQDYPSFSGPLFKSSISLVNTGVTSIEIKVGGISSDILSSYTAAKEGLTYSLINGNFVNTSPTPGTENQALLQVEDTNSSSTTTSNTTQGTLAQSSVPLSDIVLYLQQEKTVVAGAESSFSVFGLTRAGKNIDNLIYSWAYGDGGQSTGSTTMYRYAYPGKYIATVEGGNGYVLGTGRMNVRVVAPDITIKNIGSGKYGTYIDIENPNSYELDLSQWRLTIDGAGFFFPKNTFLAGNNVTHISGVAMGFASTTIASSTTVKILFPNQEEITRYVSSVSAENFSAVVSSSTIKSQNFNQVLAPKVNSIIKSKSLSKVLGVSSTTLKNSSTTKTFEQAKNQFQKDTRIVSLFRSMFSR